MGLELTDEPTRREPPSPRSGGPREAVAGTVAGADGRVRRFLRAHWLFLGLLVIGAALRVVTVLGYRTMMWFPDTNGYVRLALEPRPGIFRPIGYSFLLRALEPFHSFGLVVALQHLAGLGIAVMVYALLCRRSAIPRWGAALAAAPVLLDAFQIQLEHMVMSDVLFTTLVTGAVTLALWWRRPGPKATAAAGLLLGLAAITRSVGLPLLVLFTGYLLIRRVGWRAVVAAAVIGLVPVAVYATWFHSVHGRFALSNSSGIFLYARVTTFVDCTRFTPPSGTEELCPEEPLSKRHPAHWYVWAQKGELRDPQMQPWFSAEQEALAGKFARKAILAQPGDYLNTVWQESLIGLRWKRKVFPEPYTYDHYVFDAGDKRYGRVDVETVRRYDSGWSHVRAVEPYSGFLGAYQEHVYLRGPLLGGVLVLGLWGVARRWRRLGGPALLPWTVGAGLFLLPPATVMFDYRYLPPVAPLLCIAAALAFGPARGNGVRNRRGETANEGDSR
ncbi:hypothetical protein SAMN04489712_118138 [Thermomonospora echinospora]|uniref:Dolichyl-phosphate-mannose-protein mannosyltransferase n=1 Tax=Thermomonospora echinospora TaxID=1992 RepID=A0A1H6DLI4_9ACTN|nr:hypothetical protein [Thermomonospora echinospora]SEG86044.1 hypothetical protein SAMN04489712_118138 [Thermomonospora echinospora]